jgi:hypothetical protein
MAEREYGAELARQVAGVVSAIDGVSFHPGFERIELSYKDAATLGFVEPSGLYLDTGDRNGAVLAGRFGREFYRVVGAGELEVFGEAIRAAVIRSESAETWAAMPVMDVSAGLYLGLMDGDYDSLAEVAAALRKAKRREAMWRLWEPQNWRPHMLACAAAYVSGDGAALDTAWTALDRYSWAAPQIAATLQRIDPDFEARASTRLDAADPSDDVWPRPVDRWCLDAKSRGSLGALLDREIGEAEQTGARIATYWKSRLEAFESDTG